MATRIPATTLPSSKLARMPTMFHAVCAATPLTRAGLAFVNH